MLLRKIIVSFFISTGVSTAPAMACTVPSSMSDAHGELLDSTNAERARNGLNRLRENERLRAAAQAHACDMAAQDRLSHTSSDGKNISRRLKDGGYQFGAAAENIAKNKRSAPGTVDFWMNSSGHRQNLLMANVREFGGAVAVSATGNLYWTMIVGKPR